MSKIIRTSKPSVLPWYAAALVFVVLCAVLPVYRLWALAAALAAAAAAFLAAKKVCPPRVVETEVPFHTGVEDVDAMLKRLIKQTKETLDGSIKAGNDQERTDTLTAQVAILESYLPKQVSGDELAALIDEVLTETGASSKKDMGRVMGALTQKTGGNFDKAAAAKELGQKLA